MSFTPDPQRRRPRVAFNAALLSRSRTYRAAGISRHIDGLVEALASRDDVDLHVLVPGGEAAGLLPPGTRYTAVSTVAARPAGRIAWEQLALPATLSRLGADLLHAPAYAMPLASPVPGVVTVHDLSFFRMPETLGRFQGAYLRAATRLAVRRAAAIIAVSSFTRRELVALAGAHPSRVHVVHNGVGAAFHPRAPEGVSRLRAAQRLPERFVLAVGTIQPRKNLGTLVDAYAALRTVADSPPELVVAGAPGWGRDALADRTVALGLERHVHRLGYMSDDELPDLYAAAAVVAVPSLYEGFGLPVIEAMACGTPVVVAASSSLPEVAGDAALAVPPTDVDGWVRALRSVLEDGALAARLSAAGLERAALFPWSRAGDDTVEVYHRALSASSRHRASIHLVRRGA